jgi:hypothetical protein
VRAVIASNATHEQRAAADVAQAQSLGAGRRRDSGSIRAVIPATETTSPRPQQARRTSSTRRALVAGTRAAERGAALASEIGFVGARAAAPRTLAAGVLRRGVSDRLREHRREHVRAGERTFRQDVASLGVGNNTSEVSKLLRRQGRAQNQRRR